MKDIKSMTLAELTQEMAAMGEPAFRAGQVYQWMHRGARSFDEMTNLSKSLRERLAEAYSLTAPTVARKLVSAKDGTIKYLWRLADGNCVESVLMRYHHGNTVCISSEVGCPMGCAFCASTKGGLVRRLTPAEMLDQVLFTQIDSGLPVSNIVLMGIGEPLDNYDTVLRFLELVNFEKTGRRISFEYAMIRDVNDSQEMAELLIRRLKGIAAHVNLIPLNNIEESPLKPSRPETVLAFQKTLEAHGIPATVRRTLGSDINASCGQLRRKFEQQTNGKEC